jgi:SagB-type dehydrogenase family enzyme
MALPILVVAVGCAGKAPVQASTPPVSQEAEMIPLPSPRLRGPLSLEESLAMRRSVRAFTRAPVTLADAAQLLWAAQGITDRARGYRAAPSAGALYPLEAYLVVERVTGLGVGVYRYVPETHALAKVSTSSAREELYRAALSQPPVREAPAVLIFAAVFDRTTRKYGERGRRYVFLEAGHAAQNVYLQATALGLGTVVIGAFDDDDVRRAVGMAPQEQPLYVMPFGKTGGE